MNHNEYLQMRDSETYNAGLLSAYLEVAINCSEWELKKDRQINSESHNSRQLPHMKWAQKGRREVITRYRKRRAGVFKTMLTLLRGVEYEIEEENEELEKLREGAGLPTGITEVIDVETGSSSYKHGPNTFEELVDWIMGDLPPLISLESNQEAPKTTSFLRKIPIERPLCAVCLEFIKDNDKVMTQENCHHNNFHEKCWTAYAWDSWKRDAKQHPNVKCPLCRKKGSLFGSSIQPLEQSRAAQRRRR